MADKEETSFNEEEEAPIDDRIKQLEDEGLNKREITLKLYQEGYSTHEIMKRHLPLKALKTRAIDEASMMAAMAGTSKGAGYLDEFKTMIQRQIGRSRELTEVFYNIGLGTLLASLRKSGMSIETFRKIALKQEGLREALETAGETAFKALEYYNSDLIGNVERERDEARAYASLLEVQLDTVKHNLDPKVRLEKMIYNLVLLSGSVKVDPNALLSLVDKWLSLEVIAA